MTATPADDDPPPQPPPCPDDGACCGNGCDPCIFDLYDIEHHRYLDAMRAWKKRHPEQGGGPP
jgi:hypothetical protein